MERSGCESARGLSRSLAREGRIDLRLSPDLGALFKDFDAAVMGRKTYEVLTPTSIAGSRPGAL